MVRAARLHEHGKPLAVEDVQLPTPADGDVLVELVFAGVNPVDRYNAVGSVAPDAPLPRTLGGEAAGHLDGVAVVVNGGGLGSTRDGLFAEAAVVPRDCVIAIPEGVSLRAAAVASVAGMTACGVVELAELHDDDRVLVLGASGGVGQGAVSYARSKGAQVWGQTGNPEKASAITDIGADRAVVCDAGGLSDAVRDFAPTVVLDPLGGDFTPSALAVLARDGRLVLFGTSAGTSATLELQQLYRNHLRILTFASLNSTIEARRPGIERALAAMASGDLRIGIGSEVALDSVNDALAALAGRQVTGKVVLALR